MPEGHTIHRLAGDLEADLGTESVRVTSPQGRFELGAARLDGASLSRAEAWGKHLFLTWSSGDLLHVHLGLIGKFRRVAADRPARDSVRLRLDTEHSAWQLTGPQTCALVTPTERDDITHRLGPDPLRSGRGGVSLRDDFVARLARTRRPIGAVLLDQSVVAGIGNVYRAELLWICGIAPDTPASAIDQATAGLLWDHTVAQLRRGREWNRIVTVAAGDVDRRVTRRIPRDDALYVYHRGGLPCRRCASPIEAITLGGRTIAFCPTCQPAGAPPSPESP